MQHKCKVTVIRKELFEDLQKEHLADPKSGVCPFYEVGQEFTFERYGGKDDFWREGNGAHCAEAWDCISRYIYTALQGGAIMRGWTNDERKMIACCNDGTRPVIFKIERQDYKVLYIDGISCSKCEQRIADRLMRLENVTQVVFDQERKFAEVFVDNDIPDTALKEAVASCGAYAVTKID